MERNVQFLADELKVSTAAEAKDRVYFVSAREALICRLQSAGVVPGTPGTPGTYSTTHVYVIMQLAGILSIRLWDKFVSFVRFVPGGTLLTGFQDRLFAFTNFEKKFEVWLYVYAYV